MGGICDECNRDIRFCECYPHLEENSIIKKKTRNKKIMKKKKRITKRMKNSQYQDPYDRYMPATNGPKPPKLSSEEQKRMEDFYWYGVCVGLY